MLFYLFREYYFVRSLLLVYSTSGRLDRITIQPGRTMKIIATVLGPLKKYVGEIPDYKIFVINNHTIGKEVLVSQMNDGQECPIQPQVQIFNNYFLMKK